MKSIILMRKWSNGFILKRCIAVLYILLIAVLWLTFSFAQFYKKPVGDGSGLPYFNIEFFRTFLKDHKNTSTVGGANKLYIYFEILNDNLTFIRTDTSGFKANFELIVAIYDEKENLIFTKTFYKEIYEQDFKQTNSRDKKITLKNHYDLPPGKFIIKSKLSDLISNKNTTQQFNIELEDFRSKALTMSDILFLENVDTSKDLKNLLERAYPAINNNFPNLQGPLYLFFELYKKNADSEVKINYQLKNVKDKTEYDTTITVAIQDTFSYHLFHINKEKMKKNKYSCIITVKSKKNKVQRKNNFTFFWITTPHATTDLSVALEQMIYILPSDSLDKYEDANPEDQKKFFISFWKSRDPNPQTENNELMEEYFKRVNYANEQFSSINLPGWRTDRGRILIKFGAPDDIERHPFEVYSVPYEIWRYYSLRRIFLFVDQSGFGDYRLSPDYMDQEYK